MEKTDIIRLITEQLDHNLAVQFKAAITAHEASTHEENIPDNKYETLALEASYLAQGQANRAQDIKRAVAAYRQLAMEQFDDRSEIRLTALVTLAGDDGTTRTVFVGPLEGGMKVVQDQIEIVVVTPSSPLGRDLIGKGVGDLVMIGVGAGRREFEIVGVR